MLAQQPEAMQLRYLQTLTADRRRQELDHRVSAADGLPLGAQRDRAEAVTIHAFAYSAGLVRPSDASLRTSPGLTIRYSSGSETFRTP